MKLIIAEKPTLARNVAIGVGEHFEKHDGYLEGRSCIISWAFGHLYELMDIEEYQPNYNPEKKTPWQMEILPFCPESFRFRIKKDKKTGKTDSGVQKQIKILNSLIHRPDVDSIVHCGDADREGEIIVRTILQHCGNTKPVLRLWEDDQTPEVLREGLKRLKKDCEMDAIANEGYARTYMDWLYGINLTRYISLKTGTFLSTGRVIAAIVKAIYDRDQDIRKFVSEKYLKVVGKAKIETYEIELASQKNFSMSERKEAELLCEKYNCTKMQVKEVESKPYEVKAGHLFSITKLQNRMNELYKMTPQETLSIVQGLYEKGYLTYPRTNTEYLPCGEMKKIEEIVQLLKSKGYQVSFKDTKDIFNDAKVESHGALHPTSKFPNMDTLTEKEKQVYTTVLNRFLAVFCRQKCMEQKTTIHLSNGQEEFKLSGTVLLEKGWREYEKQEKKDVLLPDLKEGDSICVHFKPEEKETQPPKHYTVKTLNNFLENPFRKEDTENEDEDYEAILKGLQIGTGATRAGIIDNALRQGYIQLKGSTYTICEKGEFLIHTMEKLHIDLDKQKTVEFSKALKQVSAGKMTVEECIQITRRELEMYFSYKNQEVEQGKEQKFSEREIIGNCPKCGKHVYESPKTFFCENKDCDFTLFKENKFFTSKKKKITKTMAASFLKYGKAPVKGLYSDKKDKKYNATVIMDASGQYVNFSLSFK